MTIKKALFFIHAFFYLLTNNFVCFAEEQLPKQFQDVDIEQKLGSMLFKEAILKDESNNLVKLDKLLSEKTTLLTFNYFTCTTLCSIQLNSLALTLKDTLKIRNPNEFQIITISIDPKDTPQSAKKRGDLYRKQTENDHVDWKFLTGDEDTIRSITDSAGFYYKYDEKTKQYAHGAAVYAITKNGIISRYLYGIKFLPRDLSFAIMDASEGTIGSPVEKMLLYCFHYDDFNGQYTPYAMNAMRLAGLITVLALAVWIASLNLKDKTHLKKPLEKASNV